MTTTDFIDACEREGIDRNTAMALIKRLGVNLTTDPLPCFRPASIELDPVANQRAAAELFRRGRYGQ